MGTRMGGECSRSAPDLSLVPPRFRCAKWTVLPCAGSDHGRIAVDLPLRCDPVRQEGRGRMRWALKQADWPAFQRASENALESFAGLDERTGVTDLNSRFTAAVLAAARAAIPLGHGRPGKKNKSWWSKEIGELVSLRKQAHKDARASGDPEALARWKHLRATAAKTIKDAKRASWRDYASTLDVATDATAIFNTIKAMDGRRPPTRSMAVMYDGERVLTDGRDKANLLARRYADVSRLESSDPAAERKLRREIEQRLRAEPSPTRSS
eukprot:gene19695-biopygen12365